MYLSKIINPWLCAATATFLFLATPQAVKAGTIHKGWNYAIDSFDDGIFYSAVGGTIFEIHAMAIKEEADQIFVSLNANLPLEGQANNVAEGGSITWGDLFFNFSGEDLTTASDKGNLFAVRFAETNDSGVEGLGVYNNVTAKSMAQHNAGVVNLEKLNTIVQGAGKTPSLGDLASTDPYFAQTGEWTNLALIDSGSKIGDINFLSDSALNNLGLNFGNFGANGSQTIGFSFDRSLLPGGHYIASLFAECNNDGIALTGEFESVPEPASSAGILALGILGIVSKRKKKSR